MKKIVLVFSAFLVIASCAKKTIPAAAKVNEDVKPAAAAPPRPVEVSAETAAPKANEPLPTGSLSATPPVAIDYVGLGKEVYVNKCGRCHALKTTSDYTKQAWMPIIDKMAVKANLDEKEKGYVLSYVMEYSKR